MYTFYLDNISDFERNDISQSIFYRYENTMEQSRLKWSQYYVLNKLKFSRREWVENRKGCEILARDDQCILEQDGGLRGRMGWLQPQTDEEQLDIA